MLFTLLGATVWAAVAFLLGFLYVRDAIRHVNTHRRLFPEDEVPEPMDVEFQSTLFRVDEKGNRYWNVLFREQRCAQLKASQRRLFFWLKCAVVWMVVGVTLPFLGSVLDAYLAG